MGSQGQTQEDYEKSNSVDAVNQPRLFILIALIQLFAPFPSAEIHSQGHSCQTGCNSSSSFMVQKSIPESRRVRMMLCLWFPNCVPSCHRAPPQTQRGAVGYFKYFEGNFKSLWTSCYQLKVIHSFNIRVHHTPFDDVISLQNWVCNYCRDKNQVRVEQAMRVVVSSLIPRCEKSYSTQQVHTPHC